MSNVLRSIHTWFTMMQDTSGNFCAEPKPSKEGHVIQSIDRAIRVLFALQGARRMTLSELAGRLELPPSTVHGIVRTLVAQGMVVQEHGFGRYQLGPAVLRLGNVYLDTLELRSKAIPWAEDLARRTGCSVRTGVLLLDDVVIIHHEPRPDGSRQMPEVGIVIPAHASALGKAILAFDDDAASRMLAASTLRSMTGETITSPIDLKSSSPTSAPRGSLESRKRPSLVNARSPGRSSTCPARQ